MNVIKKVSVSKLYKNGLGDRGRKTVINSFVERVPSDDSSNGYVIYYYPKLWVKIVVTLFLPLLIIIQGIVNIGEVIEDYLKFIKASPKNKKLCRKDGIVNMVNGDNKLFNFLETLFKE